MPVSAELLHSEYFNGNGDGVRATTLEDTLVKGWTNLATEIDISTFNLSEENIGVVFEVLNRPPELFHVSPQFSYYPGYKAIMAIAPSYTVTDKTKISQMRTEIDAAVANALSFLPTDASDVEKALVLHDFIATHCDYVDDESRAHIRDIYGALVERKAVCAGYTSTYNYLLSQVGINTEYVTSEPMNHAWSMVTLNSKKYHVDVTWDDPTTDNAPQRKNYVYHDNFLLNDSGIRATEHSSWEVPSNATASDSKYNSYFWKNASPYAIPCLGGYAYAFNYDSGELGKYNLSDGKRSSKLLTVKDTWDDWYDKYSYWPGNYSGVQIFNGALIYNTPTKVYSYNLSTAKTTEISFSYSSSYGYIYGLHQEALGQIQACFAKEPDEGAGTFIDINLKTTPVTGVSISPTTKQLTVGDTLSLTATVQPSNATNKAFTWKSSNTAVATVNSTGKVTAIAAGTATITVTTSDGAKTATCTITVKAGTVNVTGVSVTPTTAEMIVGDTLALTATVLPSNATKKDVTWKSSDTAVATVDSTGKITAVATGTATITVTTADGAKTATCEITVKAAPVPVASVSVSPKTKQMIVGDTLALTATVLPSNATNKDVTWKSSNTAVATVDSTGKVTAVAAGSATITVTTSDGAKTAACVVNVASTYVNVSGISLDRTSARLKTGDSTLALIATIQPADATDKTISWKSSDTNVAIVTSTGTVFPVLPGTAIITATTNNGSFSASCAITVYVAVTGVTLNRTSATLNIGEAPLALVPVIAPENATDKSVSWQSSDTTIATVDSTGNVTAVAPGKATITVTTADGSRTATCVITVPIAVTGIALNCKAATIKVGSPPLALKATLTPTNATNKAISWTSSNPAVAKIDSMGKVTALASGTAIITATTVDGGFTASCEITVVVPVKGIALNQDKTTISIGSTLELIATITPDNATDKTIAWNSSDNAVASVDANGIITANDIGTATITATTTDGAFAASCDIVVIMPLNMFKLSNGWNLVAFRTLPADMADLANETILECASESYIRPTEIQLHKAYWIYSTEKRTLHFTASSQPVDENPPASSNGFVGLSTTIPPWDMETTIVYEWNGHGFHKITDSSQLQLAHGYWIKKSQPSQKP